MSINPLNALATTALCMLVFLLGFVLQRRGRPHHVLLLTAHKLLALAALVLFILAVYRANRATPLDTPAWLAAVLTVVVFVTAIISGGLVSLDRPPSLIARALHWAAPFLAIAGVAVTFFLHQ